MPSRVTIVGAVHLLLIRDSTVLLLKRQNTGWHDGDYSVPAGHIEHRETVREAMVREVREETGLVINQDDLVFSSVVSRKGDEDRLDFFFTIKQWSGEPTNTEPDRCSELLWVPLTHLPDNVIGYVRQGIENYLTKTHYSEYGWQNSEV